MNMTRWRSASAAGLVLLGGCPANAMVDPVPWTSGAPAFDRNEADTSPRYTISGLIAAAYQFEIGTDSENEGGAITVRPGIDVALSDADHVFLEFALTQGNGVNAATPFSLSPWGADLEDDLENINGSDIDALQNLWYRRSLSSAETGDLAVTIGFIDSTEFLDQNELANDE